MNSLDVSMYEEPYFIQPTTHRFSLNSIREYINGFINMKGGTIFIGFSDQLVPTGYYLHQTQKDDIRLQIDAFMNSCQPQTDSDLVKMDFCQICIQNTEKQKHYLIITVRQGIQPIYFINSAKCTAYIATKQGLRLLTQTEILRRYQMHRNTVLDLEEYNQDITIQESVIRDALLFIQDQYPPTKIICLEGPKHSGKSWLISEFASKTNYDITIQVDSKNFTYLNELYRELISQLNPELKFHYKEKKIKIQKQPHINNIMDLFNEQEITQHECPILRDIFINLFEQDKTYLVIIENLETSCDRFIPKGKNVTCLITSNQIVDIDDGPACDIIHLETRQLNVDGLTALVKQKYQILLHPQIAQKLLAVFNFDTSQILSLIENNQQNINKIEASVKLKSFSSAIFYFEELKNPDFTNILNVLSVIPDKFSLSMIDQLDLQTDQIFKVNQFLQKKNGYFRVDDDIKKQVLNQMTNEQIEQSSFKFINSMIQEIIQLNEKYRIQFHGNKQGNTNILVKLYGKIIQEWINNQLLNLQQCIEMTIQYGYREKDIFEAISVMLAKRVSCKIQDSMQSIAEKYNLLFSAEDE